MDFPSSSTLALSCPKRVLPPPATTYPARLEVAEIADPVVRRFILPPRARVPAAESPTRAIFPANSAGAAQSSPPSAKHSTDDPPTASSNTPLQISAWPRENLSRQIHSRSPHRNFCEAQLPRSPLPAANPPRRFLPRGTTPNSAPKHSSTREHSPANHIARCAAIASRVTRFVGDGLACPGPPVPAPARSRARCICKNVSASTGMSALCARKGGNSMVTTRNR